ncbi:GNAT family N-acetyltransferase [Tumebacillus permanentifrigoris]|uniref:Acetyltransferase (GNAT) family protein n=1 Tax=Tumebacillus permanentifrigoris TaxID=378543 RepID=A0A316D5Z8_9BACL|nr:GNAT family N-acetyltransferase [Tumebacillus permanentifrigoris]PWK09680.1 acetyltransferase (GNAT) family protein [Tumebacillus permanentifrigoris]
MRFLENVTPVFTERHLDHLERYRASYGEDFFSPEAIAHQRAQVQSGHPSPRCGVNSKCFEIFHEGQHIGDLALILNHVADAGQPAEDRYELDLMIFHEHSAQGLAKQALQEFLELYKETYEQPLEALVRKANPLFAQVVHLLERAGFVVDGDLGADVVYVLR